MLLCYGTFVKVLYEAQSERKLPKKALQEKIIGLVCKQYIESGLSDTVSSNLFNCKQGLNLNIIDKANEIIRTSQEMIWAEKIPEKEKAKRTFQNVADDFRKIIMALYMQKKDNCTTIVSALLEIIKNDHSIDDDTIVDIVSNRTKRDLLSQNTFVVHEFLTGVLLYAIAYTKNKQGRHLVDGVTATFIEELSNNPKIKVVFARDVGNEQKLSDNAPSTSESSEIFDDYLKKSKERHSVIKNLLYHDKPKPFYEIYVQNNVKHEVKVYENITAATLTELSRFIILEGIGGLGKSMMMRHLWLNASDNLRTSIYVPIFISLINYGKQKECLEDYIFSILKGFKVNNNDFIKALSDGSFILLFDGLDELSKENYNRFQQEIENFTDIYSQNCFVISSRPVDKFISFGRFSKVELHPFTKEQAVLAAGKLDCFPNEVRMSFCDAIKKTLYGSHCSFVENPLLLTIMMMTFERLKGELPSKMHEFYREAFVTMFKKHDGSKPGFEREWKSNLKMDIFADYFGEVCFYLYHDEKYEFTEDDFVECYDKSVGRRTSVDALSFLHDLQCCVCVLYLENDMYRYVHRSFQEYFCAFHLKKGLGESYIDENWYISFLERSYDTCENILPILFDMTPKKVEKHIFIPLLKSMLEANDYWSFIEKVFPDFKVWSDYDAGVSDYRGELVEIDFEFGIETNYGDSSKVLSFIMLNVLKDISFNGTYYENSEIMSKVPQVVNEFKSIENNEKDSVSHTSVKENAPTMLEYSTFFRDCGDYWVNIAKMRKNPEKHRTLLALMEHDDFEYKVLYFHLIKYLNKLKTLYS